MDGRITHGVSSNDARNNWGEVLGAAHNAPVTITSYGRNVAVLMDPQLAKRALEALEAVEDLAAADAALADTSDAVAWQGGGGVGAGIPVDAAVGIPVELVPVAGAQLAALDGSARPVVQLVLKLMSQSTRPLLALPLPGRPELLRVRGEGYRIVYKHDGGRLLILSVSRPCVDG
ncbi:type II toxin-antitoxin system Phd/YefM family antitoxin [Arthrobacter sp. A2-55]|uniref:type II toxin-antitoxin system Phd/YefM family antitoxin n=1 Tax=Arthrobacter sp. A2-55 TaxID=2897337 RepID=UPI0021CD4635|nr:type II toxin-antitoxin system Phd/YefM family antitoxin [Arthrobacter sp. A2-55]MCU6482527.1 type II toxin-antitoxin system Phd/YefM family antitoxin [Arthrobacter sp. A2-55]